MKISALIHELELTEQNDLDYTLMLDSYLTWNALENVKDHSLSVTAGYNQEYRRYHWSSSMAQDVLSSSTPTFDAAATPSSMKFN